MHARRAAGSVISRQERGTAIDLGRCLIVSLLLLGGADGAALAAVGPQGAILFPQPGVLVPGEPAALVQPRVELTPLTGGAPGWRVTLELSGLELEGWSTLSLGELGAIRLPGGGVTGSLGRPVLPALRRLIPLPPAIKPELTVRQAPAMTLTLAELGLPGLLEPHQRPRPKARPVDRLAPLLLDRAFYEQDRFTPTPLATLRRIGVLAGQELALLEIRPVRYNPVRQEVQLVTRVELELRFLPVPDARATGAGASPPAEPWLAPALPQPPDPGVRPPLPLGYLILVGSQLADSQDLADLVRWKREQGYVTTVATTAETGTQSAEIRAFLQQARASWEVPPSFVLLVGDVDTLPHHRGRQAGVPATDLYFAALDDGDDWLPDLAVGRLPARTPQELQQMVAKLLEYERVHRGPGWERQASFLAGRDHAETTEATHDFVIDEVLGPRGWNCERLYAGAAVPDILAALDEGRGLLVYSGHGVTQGWNDGDAGLSLDGATVRTLEQRVPPVVLSFACLTGQYASAECFGESWLRSKGGAVAFFGSSGGTFWDEDDLFERALFRELFPAAGGLGATWLGGFFQRGRMQLLLELPDPPTVRRYFEQYNLLGDPALDLWTALPAQLTVAARSLQAGATRLEVDAALAGALIGVSRDGAWLGAAYTGPDGRAVVELPATGTSRPGELLVVGTAHDHLPAEVQVRVDATSDGLLLTEAAVFGPHRPIGVTVVDRDLRETERLSLPVQGGLADAEWPLPLIEQDPGVFQGELRVRCGAEPAGEAVLLVEHGAQLRLTYLDEADGRGGSQVRKTATVRVDCAPPRFEGLSGSRTGHERVELEWRAAEDESGPITYRVYRRVDSFFGEEEAEPIPAGEGEGEGAGEEQPVFTYEQLPQPPAVHYDQVFLAPVRPRCQQPVTVYYQGRQLPHGPGDTVYIHYTTDGQLPWTTAIMADGVYEGELLKQFELVAGQEHAVELVFFAQEGNGEAHWDNNGEANYRFPLAETESVFVEPPYPRQRHPLTVYYHGPLPHGPGALVSFHFENERGQPWIDAAMDDVLVCGEAMKRVTIQAGEGDYIRGAFHNCAPGEACGDPARWDNNFTRDYTIPLYLDQSVQPALFPAQAVLQEGEPLTLDASQSRDNYPPHSPWLLETRWDLDGDGAFDLDWSQDKQVSVTWHRAGEYRVRLEVRNPEGQRAEATAEISVEAPNRPPVPRLVVTPAVLPRPGELTEFTYDATGSWDPDGDLTGIRWDFDGDGRWDRNWSAFDEFAFIRHSFAPATSFTARVEVRDSLRQSQSIGFWVKVRELPDWDSWLAQTKRTRHTDLGLTNGVGQHYVVRAVDALGNAEENRIEVFLTPRSREALYQFPLTEPAELSSWSAEGGWAYGVPQGRGGGEAAPAEPEADAGLPAAVGSPDPSAGYLGEAVFGYRLEGDYDNELAAIEYLTLGPLDCTRLEDAQLVFQRWLGVAEDDEVHLQGSVDGESWQELWSNHGEAVLDADWTLQEYDVADLASGQPQVFFRWGLGPTDQTTRACGWNIDEIELQGVLQEELPAQVRLDAAVYGPADTPVATVLDPGASLAEGAIRELTVRNARSEQVLRLILEEHGAARGQYTGRIPLVPVVAGAPVPDTPGLRVEHGDRFEVRYHDPDSGGGLEAVRTATAEVDLRGPQFEAVRVVALGPTSATLAWRTDEPADGWVTYGQAIPVGEKAGLDEPVLEHEITLSGLDPDTSYAFLITSTDRVGNRSELAEQDAALRLTTQTEAGGRQLLYRFDFETDPGWSVEPEWERTSPGAQGALGPDAAYSGSWVYRFAGRPGPVRFPPVRLTSAPLNLAGVQQGLVRYWRWPEADAGPTLSLAWSTDGERWTPLAPGTEQPAEHGWWQITQALPAETDGQAGLQLRWEGAAGVEGGVHLDDVELFGIPAVSTAGIIQLERGVYDVPRPDAGNAQSMVRVRVTVADADAGGVGPLQPLLWVTAGCATEAQGEQVALRELEQRPGIFTGELLLARGEPRAGDGVLQVGGSAASAAGSGVGEEEFSVHYLDRGADGATVRRQVQARAVLTPTAERIGLSLTPPGDQLTGHPFGLTVRVLDPHGRRLRQGGPATLSLAASVGAVEPSSLPLREGQWEGEVVLDRAGERMVLRGAGGGLVGETPPFRVRDSAVTRLVFRALGEQVVQHPFEVQLSAQDTWGQPVELEGELSLHVRSGGMLTVGGPHPPRLVRGSWTGLVLLHQAAADEVLIAELAGLQATSNSFRVLAAPGKEEVSEAVPEAGCQCAATGTGKPGAEPTVAWLGGLGLIGLCWIRRR